VKEYLQGKRFESEDNISTAVTASLHYLNKDEHRAAVDRLPHSWEECVDSAGDYIVEDVCFSIQEYQQCCCVAFLLLLQNHIQNF
jgi:hypothetical protein